MTTASHASPTNVQGAALLATAGVLSTLEGARSAVPVIKACLQAAAARWPDAQIGAWLPAIDRLMAELRKAAVNDDAMAVRMSQDPPNDCSLLQEVLKWDPPVTRAGVEIDLSALLGRSLAVHAERGTTLPQDLISGALTLRRANRAKGRRARDWERLLGIDLTSIDQLNQFRQSVAPHSPCRPLVMRAIEALATSSIGPLPTNAIEAGSGAAVTFEEAASPVHPDLQVSHEAADTDVEQFAPELLTMVDDEGNSRIPDIRTRIAAADYASVGEKLGQFHRDRLLPEDLRLTCRRIVLQLDNPDRVKASYALLALISLVTGCTDEVALNLRFSPQHTIWIDLDRQAWCWSFAAYRRHEDLPGNESDAIYCPLPLILARRLSMLQALATSPDASLGDVIIAWQRKTCFDLPEFRRFLRGCGDSAHPAQRGRFARSLTDVILQRTGSDMAAALLSGRFQATAPAALYYYSPTTELLWSRINTVYQWLGLGGAAPPAAPRGRLACTKVLEDQQCTAGWESLVTTIEKARLAACAASLDELRPRANRWLRLIAFGFVVQTAHRGVRLDRLTYGALYAAQDMGVIHDKDDAHGERWQPRLIPWTTTVRGLLSSALECHQLISSIEGNKTAMGIDAPVFIQWPQNGEAVAIRTADLAPVAHEFFRSEVNFGRAQWVTSLDRDCIDRWLVRCLTGHTRDVTRTSGAYFDVPPTIAAARLRDAMERTGTAVFGQNRVVTSNSRWAPDGLVPERIAAVSAQPGGKVPDPRTLLPPVTARTLMGWSMATMLRTALAQGSVNTPLPALATLHLLFIDLIPDPELALEAVLSSPTLGHRFGQRQGLLWKRPHLVNATWLPVQATTWRLLEKTQSAKLARADLIRDICAGAITAVSCASWPDADDDRWATLTSCAQNFRRLALPPSLAAMSALEVSAPSLSKHSLSRLAGEMPEVQAALSRPPKLSSLRLSARDEGLDVIAKSLNKYANNTRRLGERRKRSIDCRREITDAGVRWTPFGRCLRDWIAEELVRTRDNTPGCYQLSSLATYLSTATLARTRVHALGDPDEWGDEEWMLFIDWTDQLCTRTTGEEAKSPSERTRHAVMALARSLRRRRIAVPAGVFDRLGERAEAAAGGSSSAVLIMNSDIQQAAQLVREWLSESPVDALMVQLRATISQEFPSRSADLSSLGWDCLTEGNGLVIRRQGYNHHKTANAIRVYQVSAPCAQAIRSLRMELSQYTPARDLLLRLDGTDAAGVRDSQNAELWSMALKQSTGDRKARPHSARAAALQEVAWPDCQARAAAWLTTLTGPRHIGDWIDTLQTKWTGVAQAAAAAGHGDLRSALGNYLAAWPLMHGMTAEALLRSLRIGPGLLRQLDVNAPALRKARSRHGADSAPNPTKDFDDWAWLQRHLTHSATAVRKPAKQPKETGSPAALPTETNSGHFAEERTSTPPERKDTDGVVVSVRYLVVRILGQSPQVAIETTRISLSVTRSLEPLVPDDDATSELTRRARASAKGRGQNGNIKVALSEIGEQIIRWQIGLEAQAFDFLRLCVLRVDAPDALFAKYQHWEPIVAALPAGLSILVRRGSAYISQDEVQFFKGLQGKLRLVLDPNIGSKPVVLLCPAGRDNRVLSARLTTVLKAGLFSIHQLHQRKS